MVGRKYEQEELERQYESDAFEFAVIYGRRRVGKTTLISEFLKGKNAIYFQSVEASESQNLALFSNAVFGEQGIAPDKTLVGIKPVFASFNDAFAYLTERVQEEPLVLAIDEYPYLAEAVPGISSVLQYYIDHKWKDNKNLMLVLCGSSMSFMEEQVLGAKSPLYGRRTAQYRIKPLNLWETKEFFPNVERTRLVELYGITGGIPQYLSYMDGSLSTSENIEATFLRPNAPLFEEPANLLKQELKSPASYAGILDAIASGASRLNEISTKAGLDTGHGAQLLKNLIALGIVEKTHPVTEKPTSRKTLYRISDTLFRFWYRFVWKSVSLIELRQTASVRAHISVGMPDFMGKAFEDICRDWMILKYPEHGAPFPIAKIGAWWGTKEKERGEEEIDILAEDFSGRKAVFGECKWRNEPVDETVLDLLRGRAALFNYSDRETLLFSKSGFTENCVRDAKIFGAALIGLDDIV